MNAAEAVFGGAFNPIHCAHLEVARAAADRFRLRKVLFVPAAHPPHKNEAELAPYDDRVRMAEIACAVDPRFEVSRIEQGPAKNYSITTVEKLLAQNRGPLAFLIGADAFADIRSWHRWQDLLQLVEFIVVSRPGAEWEAPPGAVVHELPGIELPVSSSGIRSWLATGGSTVAVPEPVMRYIRAQGLYRSQPR